MSLIFESLLTAFFFLLLIAIVTLIGAAIVIGKKAGKDRLKGTEKRVLVAFDKLAEDGQVLDFQTDKAFFFQDLIDLIKIMTEDPKIEEVILDIDRMSLSASQVEDLRPLFKELRAKKQVTAIASFLDRSSYQAALLASKIYLYDSQNSRLLLRGYCYQDIYKKGLLNKLGINLQAIHIGDYKVAGEAYANNHMSDARRKSLEKMGKSELKNFTKLVLDERNVDIKKQILEGDLLFINPQEAENQGLIDGTRSDQDLKLNDKEETVDLDKYRKAKQKELAGSKLKSKSDYNIGLLYLEGKISPSSGDSPTISAKNVQNKLDQLAKYKNIKALVLRINSPGGSALESEKIYRLLKATKLPIYVSMGEYCASGGYYIASTGKKLLANLNTLTGSIGVVSLYPEFDQALKKLDLKHELVAQGAGVDLFNPLLPLSDPSRLLIIKNMEEVYREFKGRVMEARRMTDAELEPLAGGRVYSGKKAKEIKLIDDLASLGQTIELAASEEKLGQAKVAVLREKLSLSEYAKGLKKKYRLASLAGLEAELNHITDDLAKPQYLETIQK